MKVDKARLTQNPYGGPTATSSDITSDSPCFDLDLSSEFRPWRWAAVISALGVLPLLLMAFGVDFATTRSALSPETVANLSPLQLSEAAHRALHGSYSDTILEWTAVCAAAERLFGYDAEEVTG